MHYSEEFIASQKSALLAQREQLVSELNQIAQFDEESGQYIATQTEENEGSAEDSGENSYESENLQTNSAMVSDLAKTLADVDLALSKIEDHTYGICEASGDVISEDRLRAYPAARTCEDES